MHLKKNPLFGRIMIRLCVPLLFLILFFIGMQLTDKVTALNQLNSIRAALAFQSIQKVLASSSATSEAAITRDLLLSPVQLRNKLQYLADLYRVERIDLYDAEERLPILEDKAFPWTSQDIATVEESIRLMGLGKPYAVTASREKQKLIAYIPFRAASEDHLLTARAVLSLANIGDAVAISRWQLGLIILFVGLAGLGIGYGLARSIVKPIQTLEAATREIMAGHLGKKVEVKTGDEIEMLAQTFNQMSDRLKDMQDRAVDANPLTHLPGNQGIQHELGKRIYERKKFVLFHVDLDRFKLFNDHMGLARGDQVIRQTAAILKKAVHEKGNADDFVGHQGGDDFVLITRPKNAQALGDHVCHLFDTQVRPAVYRKEDLERGHTMQIDRRGMAETGVQAMRKFPLLSITLAGVSNQTKDFADYFTCMQSAAKAKEEAKKIVESCAVIYD